MKFFIVAVPIAKVELKLEAGKLCKSSEKKSACQPLISYFFLIVGYFLFLQCPLHAMSEISPFYLITILFLWHFLGLKTSLQSGLQFKQKQNICP